VSLAACNDFRVRARLFSGLAGNRVIRAACLGERPSSQPASAHNSAMLSLRLAWIGALFASTADLVPDAPFGYALFLVHGATGARDDPAGVGGALPYLVLQLVTLIHRGCDPGAGDLAAAQLLDLAVPKGPKFK